jgi:hypothetical protein
MHARSASLGHRGRGTSGQSNGDTCMQLHFDPLGGLAGDMIVAALLDLAPDSQAGLLAALARCPLLDGVTVEVRQHGDGILTGRRFIVSRVQEHHHHHHHDDSDHHHHHGHTAWRDIRAALAASALGAGVVGRAIDIFTLLAEAEARVHGVAPDDVHFHEVGAWDSIADIVAAAWLIESLSVTGCSTAPLPLGSGRVMTAHGPLPVPAPATALLLEGFATVDDGIGGERVTPTGAAILRHLRPGRVATPRRLSGSGFGFGTRTLPGISNCLRILAFAAPDPEETRGRVAVLEFEIDDQTAEDLAIGLDRLRERAGVLDVVQAPVFGKKGRMMTHVRMLVRPEALDAVLSAAFDETSTIGIRHRIVERSELQREQADVEIGGRSVRVKSVDRPGGRSHKVEADDAAREGDRSAREGLRRAAEALAEGS